MISCPAPILKYCLSQQTSMPILKSALSSLLVTLGLFFALSLSTLFLGSFDNPLVSIVGFFVVWILLFGLFED